MTEWPALSYLPGIGKKQLLVVARRRDGALTRALRFDYLVNECWFLMPGLDGPYAETLLRLARRLKRGAGAPVGAVLLLDRTLYAFETEAVEREAYEARLCLARAGNGSDHCVRKAMADLRARTTPAPPSLPARAVPQESDRPMTSTDIDKLEKRFEALYKRAVRLQNKVREIEEHFPEGVAIAPYERAMLRDDYLDELKDDDAPAT